MNTIDLSIIIVSYNTKEFLKKCLASILDSIDGKLNYDVIVVDNDSSDDTKDMIGKEFLSRHFGNQAKPKHPESPTFQRDSGQARMTEELGVIYIQNEKNLGFSKANNIGVKQAKGRYVLFLNPDTIVYPNTLETMVDFMDKNKDAGAATCKVVLPNGEIDDASHRGFPTPWNAFCYFSGLSKLFPKSKLVSGYTLTFLDLSTMHEIDSAAGSFMLVRREAGKGVGWWDEDYFFYGEDLDFCYKLKEKKWKIYYVPTTSILHYKGVSGGIKSVSKKITTADNKTKKLATQARFNAMRIFYKKHYQEKYPRFITWFIYGVINIKERLSIIKSY